VTNRKMRRVKIAEKRAQKNPKSFRKVLKNHGVEKSRKKRDGDTLATFKKRWKGEVPTINQTVLKNKMKRKGRRAHLHQFGGDIGRSPQKKLHPLKVWVGGDGGGEFCRGGGGDQPKKSRAKGFAEG